MYDVIYADPPWRYNFTKADSRAIENQYPTMSIEDICALDVAANADAILYLWATAPKLLEALQVIDAWGFEYRTQAVWDKMNMGMGFWFRGQHEILMVGVRGTVSPPSQSMRVSSVIRCKRGRHSSKPDVVRSWIEQWYPSAKRLEMFARAKRPAWDAFGNQVEHDLLSDIHPEPTGDSANE